MENNDKIFDQFKNAAANVAPEEFVSMDKVWSQIEDKLDNKVIKNETKAWKKIAVAALILLCVSIGFQLLQNDHEITKPNNQIVIEKNSTKNNIIKTTTAEAEIAPKYPNIKENANKILQEKIATNAIVANNETKSVLAESPIAVSALAAHDGITLEKASIIDKKIVPNKPQATTGSHFFRTKIYDAVSVHRNYEEVFEQEAVANVQQDASRKQNPLYIIDGEAVANNANSNAKTKLDANNIENIVILKEPLYIINGVEYSEEALFGEKPTSPYAPLDKQEILKTIILQGDEAEELYGKKGKKGVVIVTTKNGKPVGK